MAALSRDELRCLALRNPVNAALLGRLPALGLNQCLLAAGCVFQAVWNERSGRQIDWGVRDYDIFYFDDSDLSWEAEDRVIRAIRDLVADFGAVVEVRNQARVHLWYERRFGSPCSPLVSSRAGIDRYLVACTRVGIDVADGSVYAPDQLDDLAARILRPNPLNPSPELFRAKAESYRARWDWLTIVES